MTRLLKFYYERSKDMETVPDGNNNKLILNELGFALDMDRYNSLSIL